MPTSCLPEDVIEGAQCIDACIPKGMQTALLISIFCNMASEDCTAESLIDAATCIDKCIPPGMRESVLIYLACQIAGGGGGGAQQVYPGHYGGNAPGITPAADYAIAPDLDSHVTWIWNPDTDTWE